MPGEQRDWCALGGWQVTGDRNVSQGLEGVEGESGWAGALGRVLAATCVPR